MWKNEKVNKMMIPTFSDSAKWGRVYCGPHSEENLNVVVVVEKIPRRRFDLSIVRLRDLENQYTYMPSFSEQKMLSVSQMRLPLCLRAGVYGLSLGRVAEPASIVEWEASMMKWKFTSLSSASASSLYCCVSCSSLGGTGGGPELRSKAKKSQDKYPGT